MIGNILVVLIIISGLFTLAMYYYTLKGFSNTLKLARQGFYAMTLLTIAASAILYYYILSHQFQYIYVFDYSSKDLPFGLLLSTFFAGQEGSFLLWLLLTLLFGVFLLKRFKNDVKKESSFMFVYTLAALFLAILISPFLKNPFASFWADINYLEIKYFNASYLNLPQLQNFFAVNKNAGGEFIRMGPELKSVLNGLGIPLNDFLIHGKGLNPLLQNFWMQIHPPLLFVGFAMATIPYSFAVSSLIRNEYKSWIKESLPWLIASSMVLGFALMVGGYWAYGVLGWGGFWGWDPVENSSLIPWLISIAAIHTFLIQKKTQEVDGAGKYIRTNIVLAILSFVFVIYSTFLTRSGILSDASVHSFVDPGMITYSFLLGYLSIITLVGLGGVYYRRKEFKLIYNEDESLFSRENGLLFGAALIIGSALIIIVGTTAPIFGRGVEIKFYNQMNFPIAIFMTALIGISLFLGWRSTTLKDFLKQISFYLMISIALTALVVFISSIDSIINTVFTFSAIFTIVVNLGLFVKALRISYLLTGGHLAHIGVGVFLLGVLFSGNYSQSQQLDLPKGETVNALNHSFKFLGYNQIDNSGKYAFNVKISDNNGFNVASPVMYNSDVNGKFMQEPDIIEGIKKDIYISPLGYVDGSNPEDSTQIQVEVTKGNSFKFKDAEITFNKFTVSDKENKAMLEGKPFKMGVDLSVKYNGKILKVNPGLFFKKDTKESIEALIKEANIKIILENMDASGVINLLVSDINAENKPIKKPKEMLTIEASIKQNINLVWLGVFFITVGFFIAIIRRRKEYNIKGR